MRGLLTAAQLPRERVEGLVERAREYRSGAGRMHPRAVIALAFFEESLRTRVGFEVAAARLQARTTSVHGPRQSVAMGAPEALEDMLRSIGSWCDLVCLRHPDADAPTRVASTITTPVINCGNGVDEHPTQALVDVFALHELFGRIDGLRIALVGELEAMRAVHSLAIVLATFDGLRLHCIAPHGLALPRHCLQALIDGGHEVVQTADMEVDDLDVIYVAGLPAQTSAGALTVAQQSEYHVTPAVAARLQDGGRILCPLPRIDEIPRAVDALPQAAYFEQSDLSVWMRMAILDDVLTSEHAG